MKVRHISGLELEVIAKSLRGGDVLYNTRGGSLIYEHDPDWELIPEVEWVDVTGNIVLQKKSDGTTRGYYLLQPCIMAMKGFEITPVTGSHDGPTFIVKRQKEQTL